MKKNVIKRIFMLLLMFISIAGILLCSKFNVFKKDYTENYLMYKEVKDFSNLNQIKEYLVDKKLPYTIKDSRLYIKDNDLFYFTVYSDQDCNLVPNNTIQNFQRLDENSYSTVKITSTVVDNELVEETVIEESGIRYTKLMNKYYEFNSLYCLLSIAFSILALCLSLTYLLSEICLFIYKLTQNHKKAKESKKHTGQFKDIDN